MEADAEIILVYESVEDSSAISNSVSPDNATCPEELKVNTWFLDKKVITNIKYSGENLATFLSTIDDLLSCVVTAEKVLATVKDKSI